MVVRELGAIIKTHLFVVILIRENYNSVREKSGNVQVGYLNESCLQI